MISRRFLVHLAGFLAIAALVSCKETKETPALPQIELAKDSLVFDYSGGPQTVGISVNRPWSVVAGPEWIAVTPDSGDGTETEVTVTTLPNSLGDERSAQIMFKTSAVYDKLTIVQEANTTVPPSLFYYNNLDKETAVDNSGWPYADEFDGWKNEEGAGSETVRYFVSGVSIRSNSSSNSSYSDYDGSGANNMFFGNEAWVVIADISIHPDQMNYALSFGTEKYLYGSSDNTFKPEEFPVMISVDGKKWCEVEYTFASGQFLDGRWDLATAVFTLPQSADKLWVRFAPTIASAHRLDDITVKAASEEGQRIDWSDGVDITIPGA